MSSRLLKKILKEKSKNEILKIYEETKERDNLEDDDDEEEGRQTKNRFQFLNDNSQDSSSDSNYQSDSSVDPENSNEPRGRNSEETINEEKTQKNRETSQETIEQRGVKNTKTKKKKKKTKNIDEEITNILNEIEKEPKETESTKNTQISENKKKEMYNANEEEEKKNLEIFFCTHEKYTQCLYLDKNNFNVNTELRRKFGKDFVKHQRHKARSKVQMLKFWLIPDFSKKTEQAPIKMEYSDHIEFTFKKSSEYEEVDDMFYLLLDSHNIHAMDELSIKYPYHMETLLVLSEYFNDNGNFEEANKYIKQTLMILQNTFHLKFHPQFLNEMERVYVNPFIPENKAFYKSLYLHMLYLENEACTNTSLEVAKLLCKVDLINDLCSILLRIDNLIIKCGLFDYLIFFSFNFVLQNIHSVIPLTQLKQYLNSSLHCFLLTGSPEYLKDEFDILEKREDVNKQEKEYKKKEENKMKMEKKKKNNNTDNDNTKKDNEGEEEQEQEEQEQEEQGENKETCNKTTIFFNNYETRLHFILPNFCFSIPFSLYLKSNSSVNLERVLDVSLDDIIDSFSYKECKFLKPHFKINFKCYQEDEKLNDESKEPKKNKNEQRYDLSYCAHLFLIRALICYPNFLSIFLKYNNFSTTKIVRNSINQVLFKNILESSPFADHNIFSKEDKHVIETIISCYLEKNNMYYKSEKVITWVHACSVYIQQLYSDDKVATKLNKVRAAWRKKKALLDKNRYKNVRASEFKTIKYVLPDFIMEKNRTISERFALYDPSGFYISLNTNLLIAFFQSLLPWYQVDYYGIHSRPITFTTISRAFLDKIKYFFNRHNS